MASKTSRRGFLTLLGGALLVPAAMAAEHARGSGMRTYFLPPRGGWLAPHARMLVPLSEIEPWRDEIAAGRFTYDAHTEMLSLWERTTTREQEEQRAYHPGAVTWRIPSTAAPDWYAPDGVTRLVMGGSRAAIDDGLAQYGAPTDRAAYNDWYRKECRARGLTGL